MTDTALPKVKIEQMSEDGEIFYRARVQVRGSPRFYIADGKEPSEALLLVAAKWHSYKDI